MLKVMSYFMKIQMKTVYFFIFMYSLTFESFSQTKESFEGKIIFDISYNSKDTSKADDFLGNEAIVYIKEGNYKQEYPKTKWVTKVIYRQDNHMYYTFFNDNDSIRIYDYSITDDTIINIVKSETETKILKTKCKSIIFYYNNKTVTYFYDENYFIDPSYFTDHKYFSYDIYTQQTKSIYLKIIISDSKSDFIMTAKKISEEKVDNRIFNVEK